MPTWILVSAVLIPQEFASSAIVFVMALSENFPIWAINLIWACTTLLDMYLGYMLGKLTRERFHATRFTRWADKLAGHMKSALGTHGEKLSLALLGIIDFPYINTFLGAWIGLPMRTSIILTFAGNFIWLLILWGAVLGLKAFVSNPDIIFLILVVVGVFAHFLFKLARANKG